ncbi:hypothetical protein HB364_18075 [Pseudoflavitalea sp. X16]|uniref:hypothetical protein n=1 Tax=Paraflavitalea devenefica TaxID=2716334 RepID=UPI001422F0C2|nr:hypothetical protein [Paraflavitalea devenefica]NII27004.1 hypothetical protein [Paraflavitalea devenefica]
MANESQLLTASSSATTTLSIDYVTSDAIGVSFICMPGNQPTTYGNCIYIWQNANSIPWNTEPLAQHPIDVNTPHGSTNFTDLVLNNNSYIIGYATGAILTPPQQLYGNICSTAFIPAKSNGQGTIFTPNLAMTFVGTDSVAFNFSLPDGILPQTNTAWAGIWRASSASYNNPPDKAVPINLNAASGTGAINNYKIGRGLTYTIGLFMSGYDAVEGKHTQTTLATSLTFTN